YKKQCNSQGIGAKWDEFFHRFDASQAVRNRKTYFIETICHLIKERKGNLSVLNLASGPCRDVAECIQSLNGDARRIEFHCIVIEREPLGACIFGVAMKSANPDIC